LSFIDINKCAKKYGIIYSDPPWAQKKGGIRKTRPNQDRNLDYSTMSLDDIKYFHSKLLAKNVEEKHNLFVWTINKYLHDTEKMFEDLGYKLHARIIWDKMNGVAPAFTVRFSHEYLLWFFLPGKMLMPTRSCRGKYTTVIREQATVHSKKPEIVYKILEDMFRNVPALELFARQKRNGWDYYGDDPKLRGGVND